MPAPSHHTSFADWLGTHATPLTHLDPEAPLDDLEPLRELIGAARVVAIGENSHFITEFSLLRQRILRFLWSNAAVSPSWPSSTASAKAPLWTPGPRGRARTMS